MELTQVCTYAVFFLIFFCIGWFFGLITIIGAMCLRVPLLDIPMRQLAINHARRAQEVFEAEIAAQEATGDPTEDDLMAGHGHYEEDPETGKKKWISKESPGSAEF